MTRLRIELDEETDAAYIVLSDHEVAHTRALTPKVLVDLDEYDVAVGVEIIGLHPNDLIAADLREAGEQA